MVPGTGATAQHLTKLGDWIASVPAVPAVPVEPLMPIREAAAGEYWGMAGEQIPFNLFIKQQLPILEQ